MSSWSETTITGEDTTSSLDVKALISLLKNLDNDGPSPTAHRCIRSILRQLTTSPFECAQLFVALDPASSGRTLGASATTFHYILDLLERSKVRKAGKKPGIYQHISTYI